jgi:cytoskeletal protein CcmA (bactofilin family)
VKEVTSSSNSRATLIAQGTRIEGRVSGSSEVLVEGIVEGSIVLDNQLVIGSGGQVLGDVSARSVRVGGQLKGNIQANDRVELLPTGSIEGDVTAPRVAIAEGGFCKGKIEMNPKGSERPGAPKPPDAPTSSPTPPPSPALS